MTFCKLLYHRKWKRRGVGCQKKTNLVNVVCERPLSSQNKRPKTLEIPYYFWRSVPEEPAGETDYKSFSHSKYQKWKNFWLSNFQWKFINLDDPETSSEAKTKYEEIAEKAIGMTESIKHGIVLLQIAKNATLPEVQFKAKQQSGNIY